MMNILFVVTKERLTLDQIKDAQEDLNIKTFIYLQDLDPELHAELCDLNPAYTTIDIHKIIGKIFLILENQKTKVTHVLIQIEDSVNIQCAVIANSLEYKPVVSAGKIVKEEFHSGLDIITKSVYKHIRFRDVFDSSLQLTF
jgi:hypothetical protein